MNKCKMCGREMGYGEASIEYCDGYCTECYGRESHAPEQVDLPEGWQSKKITEIFEESDFSVVENLISSGDWDGLKAFLNTKKMAKKLKKQNILPTYLFYAIQASVGGIQHGNSS